MSLTHLYIIIIVCVCLLVSYTDVLIVKQNSDKATFKIKGEKESFIQIISFEFIISDFVFETLAE